MKKTIWSSNGELDSLLDLSSEDKRDYLSGVYGKEFIDDLGDNELDHYIQNNLEIIDNAAEDFENNIAPIIANQVDAGLIMDENFHFVDPSVLLDYDGYSATLDEDENGELWFDVEGRKPFPILGFSPDPEEFIWQLDRLGILDIIHNTYPDQKDEDIDVYDIVDFVPYVCKRTTDNWVLLEEVLTKPALLEDFREDVNKIDEASVKNAKGLKKELKELKELSDEYGYEYFTQMPFTSFDNDPMSIEMQYPEFFRVVKAFFKEMEVLSKEELNDADVLDMSWDQDISQHDWDTLMETCERLIKTGKPQQIEKIYKNNFDDHLGSDDDILAARDKEEGEFTEAIDPEEVDTYLLVDSNGDTVDAVDSLDTAKEEVKHYPEVVKIVHTKSDDSFRFYSDEEEVVWERDNKSLDEKAVDPALKGQKPKKVDKFEYSMSKDAVKRVADIIYNEMEESDFDLLNDIGFDAYIDKDPEAIKQVKELFKKYGLPMWALKVFCEAWDDQNESLGESLKDLSAQERYDVGTELKDIGSDLRTESGYELQHGKPADNVEGLVDALEADLDQIHSKIKNESLTEDANDKIYLVTIGYGDDEWDEGEEEFSSKNLDTIIDFLHNNEEGYYVPDKDKLINALVNIGDEYFDDADGMYKIKIIDHYEGTNLDSPSDESLTEETGVTKVGDEDNADRWFNSTTYIGGKNNFEISTDAYDSKGQSKSYTASRWSHNYKNVQEVEDDIENLQALKAKMLELEDKGFKNSELKESLSEGAAEEMAMHGLKEEVANYIYEFYLAGVDDNIAHAVHASVPQYNIDWCNEEGDNFIANGVDQMKHALARKITDALFANAPRELGESLKEELSSDEIEAFKSAEVYDDVTPKGAKFRCYYCGAEDIIDDSYINMFGDSRKDVIDELTNNMMYPPLCKDCAAWENRDQVKNLRTGEITDDDHEPADLDTEEGRAISAKWDSNMEKVRAWAKNGDPIAVILWDGKEQKLSPEWIKNNLLSELGESLNEGLTADSKDALESSFTRVTADDWSDEDLEDLYDQACKMADDEENLLNNHGTAIKYLKKLVKEAKELLDESINEEIWHNRGAGDCQIIERSASGRNALLKRLADGALQPYVIALNMGEDSWGQGKYYTELEDARRDWKRYKFD